MSRSSAPAGRCSGASAFVLGTKAPQVLAIARSLGRRGIPVYAFGSNSDSYGFYSRYCRPIRTPDLATQPNDWLDTLISVGETQPVPPLLFPCNDESLLTVAKNSDRLSRIFRIDAPALDVIETLLDKVRTSRRAAALGIPVPRYLVVDGPPDEAEVEEKVGFPCALKPVQSHTWKKIDATTKLIPCHCREELREKWKNLKQLGADVFITELIPGDDREFYAFYSYVNQKGRPLFSYTKRKLRQYPAHFGVGTLHEGIREPKVAQLGISLLEGLGHRGFAHVEFKRDVRSGEFKLIEMNPRWTIPVSLVIASGIDVPYMAYREMSGEQPGFEEPKSYRKKLLLFELDFDAFRAYRKLGTLTWWTWLASLRGTNVFGIFSWDDPMPFVRSLLKRLTAILRRPAASTSLYTREDQRM